MRTALLPLDDRPYNLAYVVRLARLVGRELLVPPSDMLGTFFTPGRPAECGRWLLELPEDVGTVIVALDMLTCGGLLASRSEASDEHEALERLSDLERLREERPGLRVMAFDTIIRTSLSARDMESRRVHRLLHRFTTLEGKLRSAPDAATAAEYERVAGAIPSEVVHRYRAVRKRKHAVNLRAVELVAAGAVDVLHLLMEDVGPEGDKYGIHKEEQDALRRLARERGVEGRVFLQNGTDEGACTLLARSVTTDLGLEPKFAVRYSAPDGASQVPTFEDRPFGENLASFVAAVGGRFTDDVGEADAVLAGHTPYGEPPDLAAFCDEIARFVYQGVPVALVDTTTNQADLALMAALSERIELDRLSAYSAWNTACNSLGTALAQIVLAVASRGEPTAGEMNRGLLLERLLDDYVYEGIVRPKVNDRLEREGVNPWDLAERADEVRAQVATELAAEARRTLEPRVAARFAFRVTLPWPRTFEPAIEARVLGSDRG